MAVDVTKDHLADATTTILACGLSYFFYSAAAMDSAEADATMVADVTLVLGLSYSSYSAAVMDLAEVDADATMVADATTVAASSGKKEFALRTLLHIFQRKFIYFDNVSFWRHLWKTGISIK